MMNDKTFLHLAIEALRNYGLEDVQLTRLGGASNTNFKVDADDKSYLLRLHTSACHDRVTISSELAWLSSLRSDTTLVIPKPVVNLNGELVTGVPADKEPETLCTLMSWVEGKIPPTVDTLTNEQLAEVGSLMAQLHIRSQQIELPEGFKRQTFDKAYFSGRLEVLYTALSNTELDKSDLNSLKVNASHIINNFAQLERKQDSFGIIHADFHSGNYLLCDGKVCIIDFDRCGFGFYLYDLALALRYRATSAYTIPRCICACRYTEVKSQTPCSDDDCFAAPNSHPRRIPQIIKFGGVSSMGVCRWGRNPKANAQDPTLHLTETPVD
jgi:Ser/Thr protein kinase RdoA (MazF antagonist)